MTPFRTFINLLYTGSVSGPSLKEILQGMRIETQQPRDPYDRIDVDVEDLITEVELLVDSWKSRYGSRDGVNQLHIER